MNHRSRNIHHEKIIIILITFVAFALRVWQLGDLPPGWRDDELINSLVISQHILDGQWAVYYADASGHEALYHLLNAGMLGLFGANWVGIRLLSAFLGVLAVPVTRLLGRKLFGSWVGLLAAAGLTLSFWSLMYSRIGLRHVLTPLLMLIAFYFFWRGLTARDWRLEIRDCCQSPIFYFLLTAVFMGLGFYTYFASRGVPVILFAFSVYLAVVDWELFKRRWRGILLMFVLTAVLAAPLFITLRNQPESESRVAELAVPIVEAQAGNFEPLREHIVDTLSMFHATGDGEWLYNIPGRPLFGWVGALFFWTGFLIALYYAIAGVLRSASHFYRLGNTHHQAPSTPLSLAAGFLLIWWLAGISPGFVSVPAASLGHTILAQSAVYMLAALGAGGWGLMARGWGLIPNRQSLLTLILSILLLASIAVRDLPDYFVEWPSRGMVRFLYRAEVQAVADFLNERPDLTDVGVTGLLAGPWDKVALQMGLAEDTAVAVRWYNPERAILLNPPLTFSGYPDVPMAYEQLLTPVAGENRAGYYSLMQVAMLAERDEPICFVNGLCVLAARFDPVTNRLALGFEVAQELDLPEMPLISNPPPPGVYAGPRLFVFGQVWDENEQFVAGDDGLWVDPYTLQVGDVFWQQHWLNLPEGVAVKTAVFGLYDPMTGERILTEDGRDFVRIEIRD